MLEGKYKILNIWGKILLTIYVPFLPIYTHVELTRIISYYIENKLTLFPLPLQAEIFAIWFLYGVQIIVICFLIWR